MRRLGFGVFVVLVACGEVVGLGPERHLAGQGGEAIGGSGGGIEAGSAGSPGGSAGAAGNELDAEAGAAGAGDDASADAGGSLFPKNCTRAFVTAKTSAKTGAYTIDPDGGGQLPAMSAYCDFDSDGGGWTLVLHYLHYKDTNPLLQVRTQDLPLLDPSHTLGVNEFGTPFWGHAAPAIIDGLGPDEVRFFGRTTGHSRVIHFKTSHANCVSYIRTGLGGCNGIQNDFTPFADHTALLPASASAFFGDQGVDTLTEYPFYAVSSNHWGIRGIGLRWEVDDYIGEWESTEHSVWVRSPVVFPKSCQELLEWNPSATTGVYYLDPDGPGGAPKVASTCNFP